MVQKKLDTDYYIDENNEVIFDRSIPYTYINYYCTSKEVGLLYYGTLVNASNDEFENHNGYLLVFDWEGNLKKNYAIGAHALAVCNYSAPPMGMSNRLTVVLQQELH